MPGKLIGPITGFTDRSKGKGVVTSAWLSQVGAGSMQVPGGGNASCQLSVAGIGNGADTTEDTLFTASIPANTLDVDGRSIWLQAFGTVAATSATKTVKMYFGTSITQSMAYTTTQTGPWQIFMEIYKKGANVQIALIQFDAAGASTTRNTAVVTTGSETDTAAITVKVTGQSSAATANLVLCNAFIITGMN